ncbi:cytochrome c biogenesis CcdA family protein [Streptomyces mutabilis]|uniref:cytochrome c biogenesis CcdA family protein n=1 Tax=Streptomyces mutabilis TaxID=67332 RepID=UPI0022BA48B8|nr:cytochrome c biogenesis CcdA family protein [Streptomyces mutabilis]MCZ9351963.1 cytochrome c biogenesis CcdA family protein [Streptomyces mutabilis]
MNDPGFAVAFLGGLLALLSPCSALLLPAFFAYSFTGRTRLLGRTALFYAGLCLTMVPLGVAGSLAGRLFYGHRDLLVTVGGWLVIALGVAQVLGLGFGSRRMQQAAGARRSGSALSVTALGAVYGLAGFCAGPILGSVLTVAAMGGDPWRGGSLLAVYALGMAVPMFVLAALWDRFDLGRRNWLRGRPVRLGPLRTHSTSLAGGVMFIVLGAVFLLFDGTSALPSLLGVETEFAWEQRMAGLGGAVSDRALLGVLALVVAAGALVVLVRGARGPRRGGPERQAAAPGRRAAHSAVRPRCRLGRTRPAVTNRRVEPPGPPTPSG